MRLSNRGLVGAEMAEPLGLPPSLAREWFNRGSCGTLRPDAEAVYRRWLG